MDSDHLAFPPGHAGQNPRSTRARERDHGPQFVPQFFPGSKPEPESRANASVCSRNPELRRCFNVPGSLPRPQSPPGDLESLVRHWKYSCQLVGYLYQVGNLCIFPSMITNIDYGRENENICYNCKRELSVNGYGLLLSEVEFFIPSKSTVYPGDHFEVTA